MKRTSVLLLSLLLILNFTKAQESRLLRFPNIHNDKIIFTYCSDLYIVNKSGGLARKLTEDQGMEIFAKFSPDGKNIAFTGQYDGNSEIYIMPAEGGSPKRLTYTATLSRDDISDRMGPNNIVMTWSNDGKNIIYRSRKQSFNDFIGQLFSINIDGGISEELPFIAGSWCSYSPDGKQIAMNQVFREFRTWKYYKGGMADDIWIFDFDSKKFTNITNNNNQDIFPMWINEKIYYCSDRDKIMNIFCYDTKTKETHKVTNFDNYDVKFPSKGNDNIVFENGGYIYVLDTKTEQIEKISIIIRDDFAKGRNKLKDASENIEDVCIAADGSRIAMTARGDIFTLPAKEGITKNITQSSNAHDRCVQWSPNGKYLAYISDIDGEFEIYLKDHSNNSKAEKITNNTGSYIFEIQWSPDSKKILFNDKLMRLSIVDIETKKVIEIEKNKNWEIRDFTWTPDSKHVFYSHQDNNKFSVIMAYSLEENKCYQITDNWYSSYNPKISSDNKYLFFNSDRTFNPTYSNIEWNYAYNNMSNIYFIPLSKDSKNPFEYTDDEVKFTDSDSSKTEESSKNHTDKKKETRIDFENISERIINFPTNSNNSYIIACIDNNVYYHKSNKIFIYDLKTKKESEIGERMRIDFSADNKHALISSNDNYYVVDIPKSKITLNDEIDLSNMEVIVDNKAEWSQIYFEAWRQMRDFFYVKNMHGVDWEKMRDKYAELLPYANCKDDVNYLIGELIGELNVGHAYIGGGDKYSIEKIYTGLLGAKFEKDKESGYFKIIEILKGANWNEELRSPLTEVGMNIEKNDFITAINGKSTKDVNDIYELLVNTANEEIIITVSKNSNNKSPRDIIVKPIASEDKLYYYNWVQNNIKKVSEATNNEVGYIHIPDMSVDGLNEFAKYFYPQLDKKALIIDDRGNGGGNVSPMILERLSREITRANMSRNQENPSQTPTKMILGPKLLLINKYSASDGDLFPYGFRRHGLGKIIGERSWGGIVGIRGSLTFVDGTSLNKPEFTSFDADGNGYIIEGYGVEPDINISNDPYQEYIGNDQQLNKAIEVIKEELKNYKGLPNIPSDPIKN